MLDSTLTQHQGASLLRSMPEVTLRLLAVASQDEHPRGLETLWQLCAHLQHQGYPVVVLDGTTLETDRAPGLEHLLRQAPWKQGACLDLGTIASSLAVIPAASGLHTLSRRARQAALPPLAEIWPYFRAYGVLVIYAPAARLAPLLAYTDCAPLVLASSTSSGVLEGYRSVKHLAIEAGLMSTVVSVLPDGSARARAAARGALQTLQQCAQRHLATPVRTAMVNPDSAQDMQGLALQLLENTGTMGGAVPALGALDGAAAPAHLARSH